jgi:hypothetical protein
VRGLCPRTFRAKRRTQPRAKALAFARMEESAQPLEQQLEEIRTQLAWVRDYL